MDPRPRRLLVQRITQYGLALCDQPGRCRGLLQDDLQGTCEAELNVLMLVLQHGIVHDLRAQAQTPARTTALLVPQLTQKLRGKVPLDEAAARWAIEAWAEALGIQLPPQLSPPPPTLSTAPPSPTPEVASGPRGSPRRKRRWVLLTILGSLLLYVGLVVGRQQGYKAGWDDRELISQAWEIEEEQRSQQDKHQVDADKQRLGEETQRLQQERVRLEQDHQRLEQDKKAFETVRQVQAEGSTPLVIETVREKSVSLVTMEFVLIPAGEFLMGSNDAKDDAKPVHNVRLSKPFYLGKYEVTQAQWQAVMGDNPSQFKGDHRPVESISWDDIHHFIQKLNIREPGVRYRLPTEAEWEYAARGSDGRLYPWGQQFDDRWLNFCDRNCEYSWKDKSGDDRYATTAPVGSYPNGQSSFGVHDMAGNVWEWVQDWYASDAYKQRVTVGTIAVDPAGPAAGSTRVIRGGSWRNDFSHCRTAYRYYASSSSRHGYLGFRLLREVP